MKYFSNLEKRGKIIINQGIMLKGVRIESLMVEEKNIKEILVSTVEKHRMFLK